MAEFYVRKDGWVILDKSLHLIGPLVTFKNFTTKFSLRRGSTLKILGDIPADANHFRIELGESYNNIGLHFNPRFNFGLDKNVIICNSRKEFDWGQEERQEHFIFQQGAGTEISITFDVKEFKVKLHDGFEFTFPNRYNLEEINFLHICKDFHFKALIFE
ncbi:galectin-1-like [Macrotis lagotis]|uniref:galectin-1-like n=1 Tax=Macrotis lagotis TaxID=92651 RepID=UPI003D69CDF5